MERKEVREEGEKVADWLTKWFISEWRRPCELGVSIILRIWARRKFFIRDEWNRSLV